MAKDWTQAKVYKMTCPDGYFYYGSTTTDLSRRKSKHKRDADRSPDRRAYKHFSAVGWHLINIELVENVRDCTCNVDLKRAEDGFIKDHLNDDKCLNMVRAFRSDDDLREWARNNYHKNHEAIVKKRKEHYAENRDEILPKRREDYQKNKDKINESRKEYEAEHRQQINARNKKYYKDHKATIASKQSVTCDRCGFVTTKDHLQRHKKSQKCINFAPTEEQKGY